MTKGPQPVAQGTLDTAPLAHVVLSIHRRGLDGTLAVWPDEGERRGQDRVLFRKGVPVAARLLEPASSFERALLPLFHRERAPYAFYNLDLVGDEAGVLTGHVHPWALVTAACRGGVREDAVARALEPLGQGPVRLVLGFDPSRFELASKEAAFVELVRAEPTSLAVLVQRSGDPKIARRLLYVFALTNNLEKVPSSAENVSVPSRPARPGTGAAEPPPPPPPSGPIALPELDDLPEPPGISDFPTSIPGLGPSSLPPRIGSASSARPTSAPATTRPASASWASAPRPSSVPAEPKAGPGASRAGLRGPEPAPQPPAGLSPEGHARWVEIARRVDAADAQNYFEMLDVPTNAPSTSIRDAYFAVVKRCHPDRLPAELAGLVPWAERLFRLVTEAHETLSNDEKRFQYEKTIAGGGGTPAADRRILAVLHAAQNHEKALVLVQRGKHDEALALVEEALALDPDQGDYPALEAQILLLRTPAEAFESEAPTLLALCAQAIRAGGGHHERALLTRGAVLKRLGREDEAYTCWKTVVEKNPRQLDAEREVRLYEMRHRGGASKSPLSGASGKPSSAGIFSKLFGGKKPE